MRRPYLFFSLLYFAFSASGQSLHPPDQIDQLLLQSKTSFHIIDSLNGWQRPTYGPVRKEYCLEQTDSTRTAFPCQFLNTPESDKLIQKAEKRIGQQKWNKAIATYEKALEEVPHNLALKKDYTSLLVRQKKFGKAKTALQNLRQANPIDAEIYEIYTTYFQLQNQIDSALHYASMAHLYNRNDRDLIQQLNSIATHKKQTLNQEALQPIYRIEEGDSIYIYSNHAPWMAYAKCKALWLFDPTYALSMKELSDDHPKWVEETECLYNALMVYFDQKDSIPSIPILDTYGRAITKGYSDEFISYEITLRYRPEAIWYMTEPEVNRLIEYIKEVAIF